MLGVGGSRIVRVAGVCFENLIARHCGFVVVPVAFRSGHIIVLSVSFSESLSVARSVWELEILMYGHASILHPGPPKSFPFSACTSYVCQQHSSVLQTAPPAASDA